MPPTVPDHELLRLIGRGSYGEVWLARNVMGAWRAVKLVRRDTFSSDRPFEREYGGIQRYEPISRSAEGVVPILHVGRTDDGFHYVMELADDATLGPPDAAGWNVDTYTPRTLRSDLQRLGRIPIGECLELGLALTAGLAHLHRHGLAHRDLKPSNLIFINHRAKLADLGLVGGIDESRSFVGTLGYIPPEGPGTVGADLFALGRVLYEAATGLPPEEFPNPPQEWLSGEIPHGALELHEIILRACEPDPSRRYPSAVALQADLALLQSGQSVRAARKLERRVRTLRRAGVMAGGAALLATLLVMFTTLRARSERANAERANQLRQRAETAELAARQRLSETQLARAGLVRRSGLAGQRFETLDLLREARGPGTNLAELRTEAIAAHALPDVREVRSMLVQGAVGWWCTIDSNLTRYTRAHPDGTVWIHNWNPDQATVPLEGIRAEGLILWPFSESGSRLGGQQGNRALVWDTETGRRVFDRQIEALTNVDLVPDGSAVLLRTADGQIRIEPLNGSTPGTRIDPGYADGVFWASPDGRQLALASAERCELKLMGIDGTSPRSFQLPPPACPQNFLWTPDSRGLVIAGDDFRGYYLRLDRPEFRATRLIGHQAELIAGAAHPTQPYLLSSSWDGTTRLWSLETGRQLLRIPTDATLIRWNREGRAAFLKRINEGEFRITEYEVALPHGARIVTEPIPPRALSGNKGAWDVSFVAEGHALAVASYDGVRIWPLDGGDPQLVPLGWSRWLVADPGGSTLWVSTAERIVKLPIHWNAGTRRIEIGTPTPTEASGYEVAIAPTPQPDSVFCVQDQRLARLDSSGIHALGPLRDTTSRLHASPDGHWVLCGEYQSKDMQLIEVPSMKEVRTLRVGANPYAVFFDGGEDVLVSAGSELRRERTRDGLVRWTAPRPGTGTSSGPMVLSPDGQLIALALGRREVTLLNAITGEHWCNLDAPDQGSISALEFSADGRHLAAATTDHSVVLWNLAEVRSSLRTMNLDWPAAAPVVADERRADSNVPTSIVLPALDVVRAGPVDFSAFFTHTPANFFSGQTDNRFADLKPGPLRVDGVEFEVRGIVQLGGSMLPLLPRSVSGIPIHRRCHRLHFLHASTWDGPERGEIGHYTVHYADGTTVRIALMHGENIHDWWVDPARPATPAPVWTGENPHLRRLGPNLRVGLFHLAWENPRPDQPIQFLSFETLGENRLPFLAGITTE